MLAGHRDSLSLTKEVQIKNQIMNYDSDLFYPALGTLRPLVHNQLNLPSRGKLKSWTTPFPLVLHTQSCIARILQAAEIAFGTDKTHFEFFWVACLQPWVSGALSIPWYTTSSTCPAQGILRAEQKWHFLWGSSLFKHNSCRLGRVTQYYRLL